MLLRAAPVSGLAARSILSTAVLFLVVGIPHGAGGPRRDVAAAGRSIVSAFTEVALFAALFTEVPSGISPPPRDCRAERSCSVCPIALIATAVLAHAVTGLSWLESFLLARRSARQTLSSHRPWSEERTFRGGYGGSERRERSQRGLALPIGVALVAVFGE